jgi:polyisoprenoid-binding protein YceI
MIRRFTIALLVSVLAPLSMASEKFAVDTGHSKIGFRVTLAKVADVDGRFSDVDATITYNEAI